jgi:hypothetical protein
MREGIEPASHGICPKCTKELLDEKIDLEAIREASPEVSDEEY